MEVLLILGGLALYFLPSIIGSGKANAGAIIALNLFLGWTFVGWVVALVWALTNDAPRHVITNYNSPKPASTSTIDEIIKLTTLKEKGAITEAEYQREKDKILNR